MPAPTETTTQVEVIVDTGSNSNEVSKAIVNRTTTTDGKVKDNVTLGNDKAQEAVTKANEANKSIVRIYIPDVQDQVGETKVNVPKESLSTILSGGKDLEIYTENGKVIVPNSSMNGFTDDLFFHLVPVKAQADQEVIKNRAVQEPVVTAISEELAPYVVSRPMTIETNMQSRPVTLVLPLKDVAMPTDAKEKQDFLNSLAIYIEHSDGTKELVRGEVVEYSNGLLGLQFGVNKFSTFTILSWDGLDLTGHQSYIEGYADGTFKPENSVTRAEMAAMLARNLGYKANGAQEASGYPDVASTHWANGVITFMKANGLMIGDDRGEFRAEAAISRAEMATIIARYLELTVPTADASKGAFTDTDGHWGAPEIAASKSANIIDGYADGSYAPNKSLTRAEAVKVVNKLFNRGPLYGVDTSVWSDVSSTHWAYTDIMEASMNHEYDVRAEGGEQVK